MDISMSSNGLEELIAHLDSSEDEQAAFLFATRPRSDLLAVEEFYPVPPEGFLRQSRYHCHLTDEVRALVIARATVLEACLIEVHSHDDVSPVWFSPTDLRGFEEWVPHVRWRLADRPYVALVFGGREFDALVWESGLGGASGLGALVVDGEALRPSSITIARLVEADDGE